VHELGYFQFRIILLELNLLQGLIYDKIGVQGGIVSIGVPHTSCELFKSVSTKSLGL
jgi:hypothetical protein